MLFIDHWYFANYCGYQKDHFLETDSFSLCRAPTSDGRLKPDVSAPGYFIFSANSAATATPTCQIVSMAGIMTKDSSSFFFSFAFLNLRFKDSLQFMDKSCDRFFFPLSIPLFLGTSMATPVTAGLVTLARQYFVDGILNLLFKKKRKRKKTTLNR